MKKRIIYNKHAHAVMNSGIQEMIKAVSNSFGPLGSISAIYKGHDRSPQLTNDGATIANSIDLKGCNDVAVQILKEAGNRVSDAVGDGTSTTILLAGIMFNESMKYMVNSSVNRNEVISGLRRILTLSKEQISAITSELNFSNIKKIADAVSRDDQISLLVSKAYEKIGKNGIITTEDSNTGKSYLEIQNSATYDIKIENKALFDNRSDIEIFNPYFLITDEKIDNVRKLVPILTKISESGRCCLILSNGCSPEVVNVLLVNKNNGGLNVAPLMINTAKCYNDLKDISVVTGAQYIDSVFKVDFRGLELSDLGQCEKVLIKKDKMTIIKGSGKREDVKARIHELEKEKEAYTSSIEKELVSQRLAKIDGGTAIIKIGGYTESEIKEKKTRLEDAISAISASAIDGVICGGGYAYFKIINKIEEVKSEFTGDEQIACDIFIKALKAVYRILFKNARINADVVMNEMTEWGNIAYDLKNEVYFNAENPEIIEPSLTTQVSIETAISVAISLIKMDAFVYSV
jgi:chaperonin GroEL